MDATILKQLNQLNRQFYQHVAEDFDQTRQQAWAGWHSMIEKGWFTTSEVISLLDIGCGNGRLAAFLSEELGSDKLKYWGIDQNQDLLDKAQSKVADGSISHQLRHFDVVEEVHTLSSIFGDQRFDMVTVFGVLHHLPSRTLRQTFFSQTTTLLNPRGKLLVTTWNFDHLPQLMGRAVAPEMIGIQETQLETGDYILDWQRGTHAYRYCHLTTANELKQLVEESGLHISDSFSADGPDQASNTYYLCQR